MSRYIHHLRIATIVGLVSIAAFALSAAPAGAGQTHHKKATVITQPATGVTATQAKLHGKIWALGGFTRYFFEYGTTPALGHKTPQLPVFGCPPGTSGAYCECPPGTSGAYCECPPGTAGVYCECPPGTTNPAYCSTLGWVHVFAVIKRLHPQTKYFFRLVGVNAHGKKTYGAEETFRTQFFIPVRRHHHH